jgi:hypothetical protein
MKIHHLDRNVRSSFHFVQNDMIALQNKQFELAHKVERLERLFARQLLQRQQTVQQYVGNRETRELHAPDCLLARSMGSHQQIIFPSRQNALRSGFSECICLA